MSADTILTTRNRKYTPDKFLIREKTANHLLRQVRPSDPERFAAVVRSALADHGLSRSEFVEAMERHGLRIQKDACLVSLLDGVARVWSVCSRTSDRSLDVVTL